MIVVVYLYFSCSFYYLRSSALSIRYINEVQTTAKDQLHGATSPIVGFAAGYFKDLLSSR
jgi:hypothetical protein